MKSKGRPATAPIKLMDGFYVEIKNKGSVGKGVIVRSVSKEAMDFTIKQYQSSNKDVIVLGEHKNYEWLNPSSPAKGNDKSGSKTKKAKAKA